MSTVDDVQKDFELGSAVAKLLSDIVGAGLAASQAQAKEVLLAHLAKSPPDLDAYHAARDQILSDADEIPQPRKSDMQRRYWASDAERDDEIKAGLHGLAQRESQRGGPPPTPPPDTLPGGTSPRAYDPDSEDDGA